VTLTKEYRIKAGDFEKAGDASLQIKTTLKSLDIYPDIIRRAAICAYESEMNIVMHGGGGTITLTVDDSGIVLEVRDEGPGIEDVNLAFQEGYSTALMEHREMGFGAGMGLPNIKKSSDFYEINSKPGKGTNLTIFFWQNRESG